jgi:hypothetical protein
MAAEGRGMIRKLDTPWARQKAKQDIDAAPDGYVSIVREETRTDEQNRKLHAMLGDVQKAKTPISHHSIEDLKLIFLRELRNETRFLPELEGGGVFPVGQKTSTLTKTQFSALVEIIFAYGAKHDVRWSDPAERVFAEYGMAA